MKTDMLDILDFDYFHCPNSGEVLIGQPGDDKIMCGCRKQNPNGTGKEVITGGAVHHYKPNLKKATVEEAKAWMKQESK